MSRPTFSSSCKSFSWLPVPLNKKELKSKYLRKIWLETPEQDYVTLASLVRVKAQREGTLYIPGGSSKIRRFRSQLINELSEPGSNLHQQL